MGAIGLVATSSATVVACGPSPEENDVTSFEINYVTTVADAATAVLEKINEGSTAETAVKAENLYLVKDKAEIQKHVDFLNEVKDAVDGVVLDDADINTTDTFYFAVVTPKVEADENADPVVVAAPAAIAAQGEFTIKEADTPDPVKTVALDSVLTVTELGNIETTSDNQETPNATAPNATQVLEAAVKANSNLNKDELEVSDITTTGANIKVKANSTVYTADGSVAVTFTVSIPNAK